MIDEGIVIDPAPSIGTVVGTVVEEVAVTIVLSGVLIDECV